MYDSTIFIVLITLLIISSKYIFDLQKKIEGYKSLLSGKSHAIESLDYSSKKIEKEYLKKSKKLESLMLELSDVIDVVVEHRDSGICNAILKQEKEKGRANSVVGSIILRKIRYLHTPRPPSEGPEIKSSKYVVDRQELKERDPTH